jgi:hypothetical protein
MLMRVWAAGICVAAIALAAVSSADAAPRKSYYIDVYGRVVYVNRPRTRVVVPARSFLDAGTEVLPGERKFLEYAIPPDYSTMPGGTISNVGGRTGWHTSPLPGPFDLPSKRNPWGW